MLNVAAEVNECQTDNGGCSHTCINTLRSFYCECPDHFYLSDNNRDCIGMYLHVVI